MRYVIMFLGAFVAFQFNVYAQYKFLQLIKCAIENQYNNSSWSYSIAFSCDGKRLAAHQENDLVIWNKEPNGEWKYLYSFETNFCSESFLFSKKSLTTLFLLGEAEEYNDDCAITILEELDTADVQKNSLKFNGDSNSPLSFALSSDECTLVAAASYLRNNYYKERATTEITTFNLIDGVWKKGSPLLYYDNPICSLALSSTGKYLFVSFIDDRRKVYHLDNGQWVFKQTLNKSIVSEFVLFPDDATLACVLHDAKIGIWNLVNDTWILHQTIDAHDAEINALAVSADGTIMVSGSDDCTAKIWHQGNDENNTRSLLWSCKQTIDRGSDCSDNLSDDSDSSEETPDEAIFSVAISLDAATIALITFDETIALYEH